MPCCWKEGDDGTRLEYNNHQPTMFSKITDDEDLLQIITQNPEKRVDTLDNVRLMHTRHSKYWHKMRRERDQFKTQADDRFNQVEQLTSCKEWRTNSEPSLHLKALELRCSRILWLRRILPAKRAIRYKKERDDSPDLSLRGDAKEHDEDDDLIKGSKIQLAILADTVSPRDASMWLMTYFLSRIWHSTCALLQGLESILNHLHL